MQKKICLLVKSYGDLVIALNHLPEDNFVNELPCLEATLLAEGELDDGPNITLEDWQK